MKGVCLLSGGIDSAVAAYVMKRKSDISLLHLDMNSNSETPQKIIKLAQRLDLDLFSVPFAQVQDKISNNIKKKYTCVVCKRSMLKIAEKFCKKNNFDFIITGENLGQVASQTLSNLVVLGEAVDMPVFRPLLGWNKDKIIKKAKEIGTYELSIKGDSGCKIVPDHPATSAGLREVKEEEDKLRFDSILGEGIKELKRKWKK